MSLDTSKSILKVVGILSIIFGILTLLGAALMLGGGRLAQQSGELAVSAQDMQKVNIVFGVTIILGLITFLQGIFSVRAAKNFDRIMPAWVFAIINLILSVADAVYGIIRTPDTRTILIAAVSVALGILAMAAANNIKKSVGK